MVTKKRPQEQVIQKLPHRCPHCDQPVSYDDLDLRPGENKINCPSCKRTYIKIVSDFYRKKEKK